MATPPALQELGQRLGMPELALSDGVCQLLIEGQQWLRLVWEDDRRQWRVAVDVRAPKEWRADVALLRTVLRANHHQAGQGMVLALADDLTLSLEQVLPESEATGAALLTLIEALLAEAAAWEVRLAQPVVPARPAFQRPDDWLSRTV